jgi:hypothetical protein
MIKERCKFRLIYFCDAGSVTTSWLLSKLTAVVAEPTSVSIPETAFPKQTLVQPRTTAL